MARRERGFEARLAHAGLALIAAGALHLGCSADIINADSSGSVSGSGGAGDAATSGQGGASASATAGSGGAPEACSMGQPPSKEPLCGPPDEPCKVLAFEVLPGPLTFRNDAPSIALGDACRPTILFSVVESDGFAGYTDFRAAPDSWSLYPTPFSVVTGALLGRPDGPRLALATNGTFDSYLYGFTADGWKLIKPVPGKVTHWANGVAQASSGEVHAGFFGEKNELILGSFYEGWTMKTLGEAASPVTLALSPEGEPHIVTWSPVTDTWALVWYPPSGQPEPLFLYGNDLPLALHQQALMVGAKDENNPEGKPHILALTSTPNAGNRLVYMTRSGPGSWTNVDVAAEPNKRLLPLGVVAGQSGGVRLLYATQSYDNDIDGEIYIAWIGDGQKVDTALIAKSVAIVGATVTTDPLGRIHMALYTAVGSVERDVRYLLLGP